MVAGFFPPADMSDEPAASPEIPSPAPAEPATRVRRISNPRPKKAAKSAKTKDVAPDPAGESSAPEPAASTSNVDDAPSPALVSKVEAEPEHVSAASEEAREYSSSQENDWPEPEPAQTGGGSQESGKRKRRRRKGKGKDQSSGGHGSAPQTPEADTQTFPLVAEAKPAETKSAEPKQGEPRPNLPQGGGHGQQPYPQQRPRLDPELVSKLALKIYLAEVSEEGVALIGDNDAKELSRRCFRLAEIFIEEQSRRR